MESRGAAAASAALAGAPSSRPAAPATLVKRIADGRRHHYHPGGTGRVHPMRTVRAGGSLLLQEEARQEGVVGTTSRVVLTVLARRTWLGLGVGLELVHLVLTLTLTLNLTLNPNPNP